MCGISGIIYLNGKDVCRSEIDLMNEKIAHRGPDADGIFTENNIGLGHRRLSILDLSEKGCQPMTYANGARKAVITYNGEVYNFKELRQDLKEKGYLFDSDTDTEVLLASYLEYGTDCIKKWNGMFAFVIYDPEKQILFGARDRFGQKPLKYYLDDKRFIFSSELKAILENDIEREPDYEAIDDFLTLQYVPSPKTGFKNIRKLPHSHYFVFDLKTGTMETKRYFDLNFSKKLSQSKKEWRSLIEKQLEEAVKKRLVSDVPLGAFLSGGTDSGAIVAFMSRFTDDIKTFSINFKQKDFNESKYARMTAQRYKTDHTEFEVKPEDLRSHIERLVLQYEEPFADPSILPTFMLSKLTKQYVTVALSGDAGDENFGGYDKHRAHLFVLLFKPLLYLLKPICFLFKNEKLTVLTDHLSSNIARRHFNFTSYFDEKSKTELYKKEFRKKSESKKNILEQIIGDKKFKGIDPVYYLDLNSYIPDDINPKVDLASMLNSLEVRSPMLDHEFAGLMAQIPYKYKTGLLHGKKIFKKILESYLPKEALYRKKHGFSVPIKHWFRNELKDYIQKEIMDENGLAIKIFRPEKIEKLIKDHLKGKDNAKKLWALLTLNLWYRQYFLKI